MQKAALQRSRHLAPGDKLGKYEVIRQIAVGGMAELYLARTVGIEGFEKLVVIKRILPQYVMNASFVNMFLNEARLAATLHHPNVAQVYDIGLEDGDYFFAMEYVHGEDLDHMNIAADEQGVPISMDAALTLVAGLCAGLHYAHDKASPEGKPLQIVHRDVSPSNVLVSYDGSVKLVDFGIARASSRPGTTQGGLKGKIAYMSPEQCRAKAVLDRRSDIYSVGTILYLLTTGRPPFKGETEYQILNQIVNDDVPPPSTFVNGYPAALEKIVLRSLARDVEKRYPTALELQGAIEDFAHESRLRVSALVLARLMGTLFPARLEEWDSAKKQGAFFVEQHVVRTLIESGRTPDRSDPVTSAKVAAAAATDDDPTQINTTFRQPLTDLGGDTTVGADPISTEHSVAAGPPTVPMNVAVPHASVPTVPARASSPAVPARASSPAIAPARASSPAVAPARASSPAIQRTPAPAMPQTYPLVTPGTLVSSSSGPPPRAAPIPGTPPPMHGASAVVQPTPHIVDVTDRVRAPRRESSPTSFVRTDTKRRSTLLIVGLLAVAGGIAAFIVARGGDDGPGTTANEAGQRATEKAGVTGTEDKAEPTEKAAGTTPAGDTSGTNAANTASGSSDTTDTKAADTADGTTTDTKAADTADGTTTTDTAAKAADTKASDTKAADTKAADTKAADTKTADTKPTVADTKAADTKPTVADSKPTAETKKPATKPPVVATKRPAKATPTKTDKKPETKEQKPWNNDSPFMPVRTGK